MRNSRVSGPQTSARQGSRSRVGVCTLYYHSLLFRLARATLQLHTSTPAVHKSHLTRHLTQDQDSHLTQDQDISRVVQDLRVRLRMHTDPPSPTSTQQHSDRFGSRRLSSNSRSHCDASYIVHAYLRFSKMRASAVSAHEQRRHTREPWKGGGIQAHAQGGMAKHLCTGCVRVWAATLTLRGLVIERLLSQAPTERARD